MQRGVVGRSSCRYWPFVNNFSGAFVGFPLAGLLMLPIGRYQEIFAIFSAFVYEASLARI